MAPQVPQKRLRNIDIKEVYGFHLCGLIFRFHRTQLRIQNLFSAHNSEVKNIDRGRHFIITRPFVDEFEKTGSSTHNFYPTQEFICAQCISVDKKEIGFPSIMPFNRKDFILQNLSDVLWQEPGSSHFAKEACDSVHPSFVMTVHHSLLCSF